MDLAHTIVAMVEGLPVQVKCNTCDGVHKYRAPKSAPATSRARASSGSASSSSPSASTRSTTPREPKTTKAQRDAAETLRDLRRRWDECLARTAGADQVPYDVKADYTVDDVLAHPTFGLGFVVEEIAFNRIKVLFQDAERTLVVRHGQKAQ